MPILGFTVDGNPVPCARARMTRSGHVYTPKTTVEWQKKVEFAARIAAAHANWKYDGSHTYNVQIVVRPKSKRGDLDNFAKSVLDALTKADVWEDDQYVVNLHVWFDFDTSKTHGVTVIVSC